MKAPVGAGSAKRRQECRRGKHECLRHIGAVMVLGVGRGMPAGGSACPTICPEGFGDFFFGGTYGGGGGEGPGEDVGVGAGGMADFGEAAKGGAEGMADGSHDLGFVRLEAVFEGVDGAAIFGGEGGEVDGEGSLGEVAGAGKVVGGGEDDGALVGASVGVAEAGGEAAEGVGEAGGEGGDVVEDEDEVEADLGAEVADGGGVGVRGMEEGSTKARRRRAAVVLPEESGPWKMARGAGREGRKQARSQARQRSQSAREAR